MANFGPNSSENGKSRFRKTGGEKTVNTARCRRPTNEIDVGLQLRKLRHARSLSLRVLAEKSGLNFNTLSLIENGKTSPSVSTLQQIAAALQVPITEFFQMVSRREKLVFQKAGHRPTAAFQNGILEDLGDGLCLHSGQLMLLSLQPNADASPDPIIHTGQEFAFCLEGQLEYTVDQQAYLLEPGDSLIFEAFLPHRWGNPGKSVSRFLLILCPSDENDRPTERHFPNQPAVLQNLSLAGDRQ
jgi:transcriptional regulator with XRE-family HTH domain